VGQGGGYLNEKETFLKPGEVVNRFLEAIRLGNLRMALNYCSPSGQAIYKDDLPGLRLVLADRLPGFSFFRVVKLRRREPLIKVLVDLYRVRADLPESAACDTSLDVAIKCKLIFFVRRVMFSLIDESFPCITNSRSRGELPCWGVIPHTIVSVEVKNGKLAKRCCDNLEDLCEGEGPSSDTILDS